MNIRDFYIGKVFDAYDYFGAHPDKNGVWFRVYAPSAEKISLIGEFNQWEGQWMEHCENHGVYQLYVPDAKPGMLYKYKIYGGGRVTDHCDPYGFGMELRPNSASVVVDLSEYKFHDRVWMDRRQKTYEQPMNIYEMHAGSWHTNPEDPNGWYNYAELAEPLIAYLKENHYNYVEFLPLSEHPADVSWGYQTTGYFSPTSRYGTAAQLKELIDKCHQADIGVILDFVPVHFAMDDYGLAMFDGTPLYEYPNDAVGHSEWGTCNFMHSRGEVRSFLQSAAEYWLEEFHFDGIRMDAISRIIYWQGDPNRGVNGNAVEFIRYMNQELHRRHPTALLIAEDSTNFLKVTAPVEYNGLGFDYKWDLGWMNDTLNYFKTPPSERPSHYYKLSFSMDYFYNELYLLPLSHDEVVHGKATIIQKMWGDYELKFPQCRALFAYMYMHPGKKLNFMGNEIGQFREWDESREQDWDILTYPLHDAFHKYIRELNRLYETQEALYSKEYHPQYFQWLEIHAPSKSVYIFQRGKEKGSIIAAFNFSDQTWEDHPCKLSWKARVKELLNSDWDIYGGQTPVPSKKTLTASMSDEEYILPVTLSPFSARIFLVLS
ncbi:MAG TPA: 1,4-alpha-glucan branching protein GlgB [Candidatus Blautia intestinigallinarum]|nr:1,4-alpha-glucan branching protein GlgB [Candidatus Blautia intestinigallinarum]